MIRIRGMYFSGTKTTEKVVECIADRLYNELHSIESDLKRVSSIDFTPPEARDRTYRFDEDDVIVFGVPVIAGRVPNVLLGFLDTLAGGGALAIPIVLYGNRNFDDALIELRNILSDKGFRPFAAVPEILQECIWCLSAFPVLLEIAVKIRLIPVMLC